MDHIIREGTLQKGNTKYTINAEWEIREKEERGAIKVDLAIEQSASEDSPLETIVVDRNFSAFKLQAYYSQFPNHLTITATSLKNQILYETTIDSPNLTDFSHTFYIKR